MDRMTVCAAPFLAMAHFWPLFALAKENPKPNIVYIFADQWRSQAVGFMGDDPVNTPHMDALAATGAAFTNATCAVPVSGPNRGCLMTGKYVWNHGVWANNVQLNPRDDSSIGRLMKRAGYTTAYIGKWHLNGLKDPVTDSAARHDFDLWYQCLSHHHFANDYLDVVTGKKMMIKGWSPTVETDKAIEFITANKEKPFGMMVAYEPPHNGSGIDFPKDRYNPGKRNAKGGRGYGFGYAGPPEYEALYEGIDFNGTFLRPNVKPIKDDDLTQAAVGYFGAVSSIDAEIGRIVESLKVNGLLEKTIIVVTSDHGEMMGSQGRTTKGIWFEEAIGVPLVISWPGKVKAKKYDNPFNSVDVVPTILTLAGIPVPASVDGFNYAPLLLHGKQSGTPRYAFIEYNYGGVEEASSRYWRAVSDKRYTYVLCGHNGYRKPYAPAGYVLYDKRKDPYQMRPIIRGMGYDAEIDYLHKALAAHMNRINDPFLEQYWQNTDDPGPKPAVNAQKID